MTNKLSKLEKESGWGDDNFSLLKSEREKNSDLVQDIEKRVLAQYLIGLRRVFQEEGEVKNMIVAADPAISIKEELSQKLKENYCEEHSQDLFRQALHILLSELDLMRKEEPSRYIIDTSSGMSIKALDESDIFTPEDYTDEQGNIKKASPKIHPKVAISLVTSQSESLKKNALSKKAKDPKYAMALAHLVDPNGILRSVVNRLEKIGVNVSPMDGEGQIMEFGREHVSGEDQAFNPSFHRMSNHSAVLASKILKIVGSDGNCWIKSIEEKKSSKSRWYEAKVIIEQ